MMKKFAATLLVAFANAQEAVEMTSTTPLASIDDVPADVATVTDDRRLSFTSLVMEDITATSEHVADIDDVAADDVGMFDTTEVVVADEEAVVEPTEPEAAQEDETVTEVPVEEDEAAVEEASVPEDEAAEEASSDEAAVDEGSAEQEQATVDDAPAEQEEQQPAEQIEEAEVAPVEQDEEESDDSSSSSSSSSSSQEEFDEAAYEQEMAAVAEEQLKNIASKYNDWQNGFQSRRANKKLVGVKTQRDGISILTENTYINDKSLKDLLPQIDDLLASLQVPNAESIAERFNLDSFSVTPSKLGEKVQSTRTFEFDDEVLNMWFKDPSISMQALIEEKEMVQASESQAAIADAADFGKDLLDKMLSELYVTQAKGQAALEQQIEAQVSQWKSSLDEQAQQDIDRLTSWLGSISKVSIEDIDMAVSFAQAATEEDSSSSTGFITIAVGVAAVAAWVALQKRSKSVTSDAAHDEGYSQV